MVSAVFNSSTHFYQIIFAKKLIFPRYILFSAILDVVLGDEISLVNRSLFSTKSLPPVNEIKTTSLETTTREVFTGRWEVFNDPMLDPRLIPDDPMEREGLRTLLLVSAWYDDNGITMMKLDFHKLMLYYYNEYQQKDDILTHCGGAMIGSVKVFFCWNETKDTIDKTDSFGTFEYIMENTKEAFVSDMVILPIIWLIGTVGM